MTRQSANTGSPGNAIGLSANIVHLKHVWRRSAVIICTRMSSAFPYSSDRGCLVTICFGSLENNYILRRSLPFHISSFVWGVVKISEELKRVGDAETIRSSRFTSGCAIMNHCFAAWRPCKKERVMQRPLCWLLQRKMTLIEMHLCQHLLISGSACYNCLGQFVNYNIYSKAILTCRRHSPNESSGKPEEG
jgi:hypothetical protein